MMPLNPSTPMASADRSSQGLSNHPPRHADSDAAPSSAAGQKRTSQRPGAAASGSPAAADATAQAGGTRPSGSRGKERSLEIPKIKSGLPLRKRPEEVRRIAIEVFSAADSWVVFYREILGPHGVARKLFKKVEEIRYWETSEEFFEIQEMLTALRSNDSGKGESVEPQRMITVRLPTSLHETLKIEASEHETSMNKLCMSKLLMSIAERFVPTESGQIRGRKPGPQGKRKAAAEQTASGEPAASGEQ